MGFCPGGGAMLSACSGFSHSSNAFCLVSEAQGAASASSVFWDPLTGALFLNSG